MNYTVLLYVATVCYETSKVKSFANIIGSVWAVTFKKVIHYIILFTLKKVYVLQLHIT